MNGSRSNPNRPGERSSLDALNRTIEGLEARIEDLMSGAGRERRPSTSDPRLERAASAPPVQMQNPAAPRFADPLAEIRERQRMLGSTRERMASAQQPHAAEPVRQPVQSPLREKITPPEAYRPSQERRPAAPASAAEFSASRDVQIRESRQQAVDGASMREIAEALVGLRHELKQDIADGVAREMGALQTEIRSIRSIAEDHRGTEDLRGDFARLADSIGQLGYGSSPDAQVLRAEFEELRNVMAQVMDGVAREDSVQRMESRWQGLEDRVHGLEPELLRDEVSQLAYRIDDIKNQLGGMNDSPALRALEQKLIAIATAMEHLGARMQPSDERLADQFNLLDQRLDEITRAVAVSSRASAAATLDQAFMQKLDSRIVSLAEQVDLIGQAAADPGEMLSSRIEALTARIEELSDEQAAMRLEERLDQLSVMLTQAQKPAYQTELSDHLADISRKIDGLDHSSINDMLGERLDYLARRIDEIEYRPAPQPASDERAFDRLETRLTDIAMRLDEAATAPRGDENALRSLEDQIAHLSSLITQPQTSSATTLPDGFEHRFSAIESYMSTNDEYILEAARQAAEAVVEAYSRNTGGMAGATGDMAALSALADDLRHLEELTRGTEVRSHQTFEALHGTLVQIANRLDTLEDSISTARFEPAYRDAPANREVEAEQPVRHKMPAAAQLSVPAMEFAGAEAGSADAPTENVEAVVPPAAVREEPVKPSLLAGLSKRFKSGTRDAAEKPARTVIEPAPSIDAADILPAGRENDLLEPGSGAPDVKKILERVRASQAASDLNGEKPGKADKSDRADYIAAARRAAKAAAQETDPSQANAVKSVRSGAKSQTGSSTGTTSGETGMFAKFSQHRRPILMAVGAVLLVMMSMQVVKTVAGGSESAPEQAALEAPAPVAAPEETAQAPSAPAEAAAPDTTAQTQAEPPVATDGGGQDVAATPPPPEQTVATNHLTDPAPVAGDLDSMRPASEAAQAQPEGAGFTPQAPTAAATEAPAPIVVPAGLEPKSLADAASSGDANALFEIGTRFTEGRGLKTDPAEAATWYKLAADRGLAPAQYRMANMFEKGTGVERNLGEAVRYYQLAAEAGNASAMHNLAVLYASGATGQPDYTQAVKWFTQAADHGVADSQFNLAILFARGNGVKQDLEESYKWFAVAAKAGDNDAAQKRDEVANAMRKEQLESARAKLDLWKVKTLDPKANSVVVPDEWATGKRLTTASIDMEKAVRNIQAILNKNGFDAGRPDGKLGAKTVSAIKSFQSSIGQEPSGRINDALVRELLARNG
jgi:localization factor PodJL